MKQTNGEERRKQINMNVNKVRTRMWKFKTRVKQLKYMLEVKNIEIGISKNSLLMNGINLRISSSM